MAKLLVTPAGVAGYLHLDKPSQKFNKYEASVTLTPEAYAEFKPILDAAIEDYPGAARKGKMPVKKNEDGTYTIKAGSKADYAPMVMDAKNNKVKAKVGSGSIIKIAFKTKDYDKGISFYLNAVRVIDLKEYAGNPFGEPEDGYEEDVSEDGEDADSKSEASDLDI